MEEQNLKDLLNTERQNSRRAAQPDTERKKAMADRRFGSAVADAAIGSNTEGKESPSNILKGPDDWQKASEDLQRKRRVQKASTVDPLTAYSPRVEDRVGNDPYSAYDLADEFANSFRRASTKESKLDAAREGYHLARILRANEQKHRVMVFILVLVFIAVPLDLLAIPLELTGPLKWVIDAVTGLVRLFLWIAITVFLFGRGVSWRVRVAIWIAGAMSSFLELVPFIQILPFYSLSTAYAWWRSWREAVRNREAAEKVESEIKKAA